MTERWARETRVLWRRSGSMVILMTAQAEREVTTLEDTGFALWQALERPASLVELAEHLGTAYGVPVDRIVSDLGPVLDELAERRVLKRLAA